MAKYIIKPLFYTKLKFIQKLTNSNSVYQFDRTKTAVIIEFHNRINMKQSFYPPDALSNHTVYIQIVTIKHTYIYTYRDVPVGEDETNEMKALGWSSTQSVCLYFSKMCVYIDTDTEWIHVEGSCDRDSSYFIPSGSRHRQHYFGSVVIWCVVLCWVLDFWFTQPTATLLFFMCPKDISIITCGL